METIEKFKSRKGSIVELNKTDNGTYFVIKVYTNGEVFTSQEYKQLTWAFKIFLYCIQTACGQYGLEITIK